MPTIRMSRWPPGTSGTGMSDWPISPLVGEMPGRAEGGVPERKPQKARGSKLKDSDTVALEKRVSDALGLRVSIDHGDSGGTVHIRYRDLDQLDEIVKRLDTKN